MLNRRAMLLSASAAMVAPSFAARAQAAPTPLGADGKPVPIIDFHTHTQPTAAAWGEFLSWLAPRPRSNVGDPPDLFAVMAELGIIRSQVVPWLPAQDLVAKQVAQGVRREAAVEAIIARWRGLNEWAAALAKQHPERITTTVGVDPVLMTAAQIETEVGLRLGQGATGIKIAPLFLDIPPSDDRMEVIWSLAKRHKVFVLSESGAREAMGHSPWGHPRYFREVLTRHPDLRLQLAHMGWGAEDVVAELTRDFPHVYTDMANRLEKLGEPGRWTAEQAVAAIREIGADRVLYATNYPLVDVRAFLATFRSLPLTPEEYEMIAWKNATTLMATPA